MDIIEGITPKKDEQSSENSEELRCVYVAITRAKRYLYLFAPERYVGMIEQTKLSHFFNKDDILSTVECNADDYTMEMLRNRETIDDFF